MVCMHNKLTTFLRIIKRLYMNTDRLGKLLGFYDENPNDPFTIYALALEYMQNQPEKAATFFERLLTEFPEYSATYYHAAHLFWETEDWEKAEAIFLKGIEVCSHLGETKALQELRNAYQNFQFEKEE